MMDESRGRNEFPEQDQVEELRSSQVLNRPGPKRKFILKKRVDEDPRITNKMNQPIIQKKSFLQPNRVIQQASRIPISPIQSKQISMVNNDSKARETNYSLKSVVTDLIQTGKAEDKVKTNGVEEIYTPDVQGPQVKVSKKDLSFIVHTGQVAFENITVLNNGTASIYYEWKKQKPSKIYSTTLQDPEKKFFCHHEQSVLKPGESRQFVFAFMSKVTGVFQELWELECEPPTTEIVPALKLTGNAIEVDSLREQRKIFDKECNEHFLSKNMEEIVGDVLDRVQTPAKPPPDLSDPKICQFEFESKNQEFQLFYNPLVMKWWRVLENDLYAYLKIDPNVQRWNLEVDVIQGYIDEVKDEDDQMFFQSRFNNYIELCKSKPIERSEIFAEIKDFIWKLGCAMPTIADKTREELGMWESTFRPPPDERDFTDAEIKTIEDEKNKIKNEWLKKTKRKKWEKEDDKKMMEDYHVALTHAVTEKVSSFFEGFESKEVFERGISVIQNRRQQPDLEYFSSLLRKKPLREQDLDGKRIVLKVHLKLANSPDTLEKQRLHVERIIKQNEEELKRIEEEKALQERLAKEKKKPAAKKAQQVPVNKKNAKAIEMEEAAAAEARAKEKQIDLTFLDQDNLTEILDCLKFLLERQAKLVILMVSYDEPLGEFRLGSSVRFFSEYLKLQVENQITFNETFLIENFEEKLETESYPENSVLVLENSYFAPEEVGFKQVKQANEDGEEELSLVKYTLEDKEQFITEVSAYSPLLVVEDSYNFFLKSTLLNSMRFENQVLGLSLSEDIQYAAHLVSFQKSHFHVFFGGALTAQKLVAIDTLARFADFIYLFGEIGFKFYLEKVDNTQNDQGSAKKIPSGQFQLSEIEKKAIKACVQSVGTIAKAKIILPLDFIVVPDAAIEGVEKFSEKWMETQVKLGLNYPPRRPQSVKQPAIEENNPSNTTNNEMVATTKEEQNKKTDKISAQVNALEITKKADTNNILKKVSMKEEVVQELKEGEEQGEEKGDLNKNEENQKSEQEKADEQKEVEENQQGEEENIKNEENNQQSTPKHSNSLKEAVEPNELQLDQAPNPNEGDVPQDQADNQQTSEHFLDNQNAEEDNNQRQSVLEMEFARKKPIEEDECNKEIIYVEEDQEIYEYDQNAIFPENHVIVDFGEQTLKTLKQGIRRSRKLGWFEGLDLFSTTLTDSSNKLAARTLFQMQEEKKERLEQLKKTPKANYNYTNDVLAMLFGKELKEQLGKFEIVETQAEEEEDKGALEEGVNEDQDETHGGDKKKKEEDEDDGDAGLDNDEEIDNKSATSGVTAVVAKVSNVKLVSDFYSNNSEFIINILQANHIPALSKCDSYHQKSTSNLSDDFPFLDDL